MCPSPSATAIPAADPLQVWLIPVLRDNYVFVIQRGGRAVVVDPAVAEPVRAALEQRHLQLEAILHTHHHSDHIGGTPGLLARWPGAAVVAAAADRERIPLQTRGVAGGDRFALLGGEVVQVLAVPGHTRAHVAYWLPERGHLFCGDTLFAAGCGRLFEGTAAQMHASLQQLAALPAHTQVWCAHEYTEANLRWAVAEARALAPASPSAGQQHPADAIAARLAAVRARRAAGEPTIPTSIGEERRTNLFVQAASAEALAALRRSKDAW